MNIIHIQTNFARVPRNIGDSWAAIPIDISYMYNCTLVGILLRVPRVKNGAHYNYQFCRLKNNFTHYNLTGAKDTRGPMIQL